MSTAKITGYRLLGGIHPPTASFQKLLAFHGILNSHTQKPFTESLLFGIGGGIGFTYRLVKTEESYLELRFSNYPDDSLRFVTNIADRLNIRYEVFQSKSSRRADETLRNILLANQPVMYWLDKAILPHYANIPRGRDEWAVNFVGIEGNVLTVDDVSKKLLPVTHELIVETRKTMPSLRNQFLSITGARKLVLDKAVKKGILDCIDHLSHSTNGLTSISKWAESLIDTKYSSSWPMLFSDATSFYKVLENIYESVTIQAGGNLRDMYGEFLAEAADILNKPALNDVGKLYKKLAKEWQTFGQLALTDNVKDFGEAKELIHEKYELFYKEGPDAHKELERIDTRLKDIADKNREWLPLDADEIQLLFAQLSQQLNVIYKNEQDALAALKKGIK